ncbi:MAG: chemotaxis protein CheW [Lachnospiraceae bacterium]|jgi:purine-binding chemotaxis protein CheW|nr:chemotaxis protein CheW [Lachnospiraceae bacterium]MCI8994147.1 chemotaxis protein CheW [Lachnospiraceae bacterium]MCI9133521.1 chemotaxis protein CheW [Lachnospiraceae bacterium]
MSEQMTSHQEFPDTMDTMDTEENSTVERCLTFESGNLILYISTKYVIEAIHNISNHSITRLPLVPPYIKGIINLRGQILPVVDIKMRMGKSETEYTSTTCIIVLDINSVSLGIIVDSVRQVMDIDLKDVRPIPVKRQQKLLDGMVTMADGSVFMSVDCQALAQNSTLNDMGVI